MISIGSAVLISSEASPGVTKKTGMVTKLPEDASTEFEVSITDDDGKTETHLVNEIHISLAPEEEEQDDQVSPSPSEEPAGESTSTWPAWPERKEPSSISLSRVDKSTWIGRPVMVMKGPKSHSFGRVVSTASGWVEMHEAAGDGSDPFMNPLADGPPINKRAHELNLMKIFAENGEEEDLEQDAARDVLVGDQVVVVEGPHEGKMGKITDIAEDGTLALSIKTVSAVVHKSKTQVELKKEPLRAPASRRGGRKQGNNNAFADLLVGKRVVVMDTGRSGVVLKSGHGFFEVQVDGEEPEMHRREELRVMEGEEEEDEDSDGDAAEMVGRTKRKRKLRAPMVNPLLAQEQDDERSKRPRTSTRRGLPSASAAASLPPHLLAKKTATSMADVGLPQTKLEATRRQRQEVIIQFVTRCKERQEKQLPFRENLQEWLEDIRGGASCACCQAVEDVVPLLFDFPFCPACQVEKEREQDSCWNPACWQSPVFRRGAAPLVAGALPAVKTDSMFSNLQGEVKISPLVTAALEIKTQVEEEQPVHDETKAAPVMERGFFGKGFRDDLNVASALDRRWKHGLV